MATSTSSDTKSNNEQARTEQDKLMSLFDHIGELRKRIIAVLVVLIVGLVAGLLVADPAYDYLMSVEPANSLSALHAFSLWDGIGMYMKFAFVIALIPVLPMAFYQLWAFVKPALEPRQQKATLRYVPFALLMFLAGLAFSYFVVFPLAFAFTTTVASRLELEATYGVTQYFAFMFSILIPISLLFELPILIMFLTRIGILNPMRLRKMRRLAYFILIFIGALITPPDLISDLLVAIPLILLYEFSVFLSMNVYRKKLKEQEAWEEEFDAG